MAVLNGLPPRFGTIITALDAIGDDDPSLVNGKMSLTRIYWNGRVAGLHIKSNLRYDRVR